MRPSTRILRAHKDRLPFNRIHMLKRFNQRHIQQTLIRPPFCVCYCRLKIPIVCFDAVSQPAAFGINVNTIFQNGRFHTSTTICINKLRNSAQFFPFLFSARHVVSCYLPNRAELITHLALSTLTCARFPELQASTIRLIVRLPTAPWNTCCDTGPKHC